MHDGLDQAETSGAGGSLTKGERIDLVKVFSVTKARHREAVGDVVTAWIAGNPDVRVIKTFVTLSSDSEFHCLSFVLICARGSRAS